MPAVGDLAPDFKGPTQTGETLRLSDFLGQPVALFFYPKDDTPGCTKQACNLRDNYTALQEAGVQVLGISADDEASHERFAAKYALPFPLIADPEHTILEAYGAWGEKNFYGKKLVGIKRTTFLIGPDRRILHVFKRPKTGAHAEEILERLAAAAS
ncbi:MAG: thioredoxin-dependent thiol peroxidase [Rhodothermaceae bacterium]|nr:thioredoxin-dependent thiol peroxidase [Rhodothermaceae bacterium]